MKMKRLCVIWIMVLACSSLGFSKDHNIVSYGAVPDGETLNTVAIQSAIDQAHLEGGGRVLIPKGRFLSGSIVLKSGVVLHLSRNAVLLGSTNPADYIKLKRWKALVMAYQANDIGISGKGVIDGQGTRLALNVDSLFYAGQIDSSDYNFIEKRPMVTVRPQIIEFMDCVHVRVTDITIKNGASWVQSYYLCIDLIIDNIRVESDAYWNNDGIDIIDCSKVWITNCNINSSDDGICLKSYNRSKYRKAWCDSIYITNCTVRSSASAVKLGTASYGGFKNIFIEKIKVYDTYRSAIALEVFETGVMDNVVISDIRATNTGNAIFIRMGKRFPERVPGALKNVTIKNVKVKIAIERPDDGYTFKGPALPFFHNTFPSSIVGFEEVSVENVVLENITIIYPGNGNQGYANLPIYRLQDVPELEGKYPEFSMFGELPAWGFYVRHVDGLTMKDIKVKIRNPDYRPAFVFDDVKNLDIQSFEINGDQKKDLIILNNVTEVK